MSNGHNNLNFPRNTVPTLYCKSWRLYVGFALFSIGRRCDQPGSIIQWPDAPRRKTGGGWKLREMG